MNADLISRAALLEFSHNHIGGQINCNDIARFPAVNAVEVVRCRDCKHYRDGVCENITYIMDGYYRGTFEMKSPDDFCSSGEKMDGDRL